MDIDFNNVAKIVKSQLERESSGHDFYHAERVFKNALTIQAIEGGDRHVIGVAALVHDLCRPWEKRTGNKSHFGEEALEIIKEALVQAGESEVVIGKVLEIVMMHDVYDWSNPIEKSIELRVVQDADNLDAIGALGIGRTFAFGGAHGLNMYVPGESLNFDADFKEDPDHRTSTIAHFYEKLLKLKENMSTETGKRMAEVRHKRMETFLEDFFSEWEGRS